MVAESTAGVAKLDPDHDQAASRELVAPTHVALLSRAEDHTSAAVAVHDARKCPGVVTVRYRLVHMQDDLVTPVAGNCGHLPLHPGHRLESGEESAEDSAEPLLRALD